MIDTSAIKQAFKNADDAEALELFRWVTACMEVRGLIEIAGAPSRKRRSDAGVLRTQNGKSPESQPSLSGLPDENGVGG